MNVWGEKIKVSIFGESHGAALGAVIDGIPAGLKVDTDMLEYEMQRRSPGHSSLSTPRKESDSVEILSGIFEGYTSGTPICGIIRNTNTRSKDYTPELLRPSHADYTGFVKYGEHRDYRGGGHFSGRITAALVFAGALAKQVLAEKGVIIGTHIRKIHQISEPSFLDCSLSPELLKELTHSDFPVMNAETGEKMKAEILAASANKNSVGGVLECAVLGAEAGLGSPFFASLESKLSAMMFSIPAVKGIEFGRGFEFADLSGSEANDVFFTNGKTVHTKTNNSGGINGGISNGMPIVFSVVIRPTPSIAAKQETVNIKTMENAEIEIKGRHDPCIVQRAASVVEAGTALTILEEVLS